VRPLDELLGKPSYFPLTWMGCSASFRKHFNSF
jgi:hypothetical protein